MVWIILFGIVIAVVALPGAWASHVLKKHQIIDKTLQGTGRELAEHLIERFNLTDVKLEESESGDHYDPETKRVRLSAANMSGQTLTAVTTAAHEVGHALQHQSAYGPLLLRTRMVKIALVMEKLGSSAMLIAPIATLLTRSPAIGGIFFGAALLSMLTLTVVHIITLPVEFNASFGRALPILREGYLAPEKIKIAEKILLACALTYLAQSLASLLNLGRWLAVLRR